MFCAFAAAKDGGSCKLLSGPVQGSYSGGGCSGSLLGVGNLGVALLLEDGPREPRLGGGNGGGS